MLRELAVSAQMSEIGETVARVGSFQPSRQNVREHPTIVACEYQVLRDDNGAPLLLHLATMGSSQRASGPKMSQALQIDELRARELVELLEDAFPSIVTRRGGERPVLG